MRHRPARALLPPLLLLAAACADPTAPPDERRPLAVRRTAALDAPGAEPQTVVLYAGGDFDTYRGGALFVRKRGTLATMYLAGKTHTVDLRDAARQRAALAGAAMPERPPSRYFGGDRNPGEGGGAGCFAETLQLVATATAASAAFWALDAAVASTGVGAPVAFAMAGAMLAYTGSVYNFMDCMGVDGTPGRG